MMKEMAYRKMFQYFLTSKNVTKHYLSTHTGFPEHYFDIIQRHLFQPPSLEMNMLLARLLNLNTSETSDFLQSGFTNLLFWNLLMDETQKKSVSADAMYTTSMYLSWTHFRHIGIKPGDLLVVKNDGLLDMVNDEIYVIMEKGRLQLRRILAFEDQLYCYWEDGMSQPDMVIGELLGVQDNSNADRIVSIAANYLHGR
ncbi:MAG: hypothetical protein ACI9BD_001414 [Candidatus Marinamargulisbacteria bacterium]|jgi:hypothetical protein